MARTLLPPTVHPALRDQSLRRAFEGMLDDERLTRPEAEALLRAAEDGPGLSRTEQKDLERLIERLGDRFDTDARRAVESFLGGQPARLSTDAPPPGEVTTPFATELAARSSAAAASAEGPAAGEHAHAAPAAWWDLVGKDALPGLLFPGPMLAEVQLGALTLAEAELLSLLVDVAAVHLADAGDRIVGGGFVALDGGRAGLVDDASISSLVEAEAGDAGD